MFYHFVGLALKGLKKQNSGSYLCLTFRDVKSIREYKKGSKALFFRFSRVSEKNFLNTKR